jgi:hypothetical protein
MAYLLYLLEPTATASDLKPTFGGISQRAIPHPRPAGACGAGGANLAEMPTGPGDPTVWRGVSVRADAGVAAQHDICVLIRCLLVGVRRLL